MDAESVNAYLAERGWEFTGRGWIDPRTKEPAHEREFGSYKATNGETHRIVQKIVPPIPYEYTEEEAIAVQEARDAVPVHV